MCKSYGVLFFHELVKEKEKMSIFKIIIDFSSPYHFNFDPWDLSLL